MFYTTELTECFFLALWNPLIKLSPVIAPLSCVPRLFYSQVEVKAVPVSQKKSLQPDNMKKLQRLPGSSSPSSAGPDLTFGGLPMPKLEATYEPMIVKEARYIAITMMKVSFM